MQMPVFEDFFLQKDSLTDEEALIRQKADMHLMKASLSKDDLTITFIYTTPDYLNREDKDKMLEQLKQPSVSFQWKNAKFR